MSEPEILRLQIIQMQATLDATERLRLAAEEKYRQATEKMELIARTLFREEYDALRRSRQDMDLDGWTRWIIAVGQERINRLALLTASNAAERQSEAALRQKAEEADQLRRRLAGMEQLLAAREAEINALREDKIRLQQQLAASTVTPTPLPSADGDRGPAQTSAATEPPPWFAEWQASPQFRHTAAIVQTMGLTGYCLRDDIDARAFPDVEEASGTPYRAWQAAVELGLVEAIKEPKEPKGETRGRSPTPYRLTARGREACRLLTGNEPAQSEYDLLLARHKSPEHTLLNIQARRALQARGYEVDPLPSPISLPSGSTLCVDIVAKREEKTLYIECERGTAKKNDERTKKWDNLYAVTHEFYLFVPDVKAQSDIFSEITLWALQRGVGVTLKICTLSRINSTTTELFGFTRQVGRLIIPTSSEG